MDINFEKCLYYLGAVLLLLLIGILYYFVKGKKDMEDEIKKKMEENEEAKISGGGNGLYTLCPTDPGGAGGAPGIMISNEDGEVEVVEDKINSIIPRVIYTNFPKTEEERVNLRREFVIQMIIAEGGDTEFK